MPSLHHTVSFILLNPLSLASLLPDWFLIHWALSSSTAPARYLSEAIQIICTRNILILLAHEATLAKQGIKETQNEKQKAAIAIRHTLT